MASRSDFSAFLDGEIPPKLEQDFSRHWADHPEFKAYREMVVDLQSRLRAAPEPDFSSRADRALETVLQRIREKRITPRPLPLFQRPVRLAWAAAAVFLALLGGWSVGRLVDLPAVASLEREETIVINLPEAFEIMAGGSPELIRLTNYRRGP